VVIGKLDAMIRGEHDRMRATCSWASRYALTNRRDLHTPNLGRGSCSGRSRAAASWLSSRRSATKTRELRNLRRARRGSSSISARTPTRSVSVSHPTLGGLTERVERVVDTLESDQPSLD
jgi:hypothetical protein